MFPASFVSSAARARPLASWADTTDWKSKAESSTKALCAILPGQTEKRGKTSLFISGKRRPRRSSPLPRPEIAPFDATTFLNKLKQIPGDSFVTMSGRRLPPGLDDSFYAQIITGLKDRNIKTFLDSDGEPLRRGVQAGPYLFKPSIHELGRLTAKSIKDQDEVLENAAPYLELSRPRSGINGCERGDRVFETKRYLSQFHLR